MSDEPALTGPDLRGEGIDLAALADGATAVGHADGEAVLVARRGDELFAVSATCTHYNGPLGEGLVVLDGDGDPSVRCPWHHACFSLRTGEATRAPALNPLACWAVERRGGRAYVGARSAPDPVAQTPGAAPNADAARDGRTFVIVGAGAAGNAAAEMLRRQGFAGRVVLVGGEPDVPYDRPNLSKEYLSGDAPEEWIPLRPPEFYAEHGIELLLGTPAARVDAARREVVLADGREQPYDALLLATGATPVRLDVPGADVPHVHYLRSLADSRAIVAAATRPGTRQAVVIGASFIGLEVAAALRHRGLAVHVVAPVARPLEQVLGPELGDFVRGLHEEHGVVFHLPGKAARVEPDAVVLESGERLPADLVVVGIGVRPALGLAQSAGCAIDNGVLVSERLETSVPGIFAAGDIARWPDARTGRRQRVEHWVVAERQGQAAACSMVGRGTGYHDVPFFWSAHYGLSLRYVGHAERWDAVEVDGSLAAQDATVTLREGGTAGAVITVQRDRAALAAELAMERAPAAPPPA